MKTCLPRKPDSLCRATASPTEDLVQPAEVAHSSAWPSALRSRAHILKDGSGLSFHMATYRSGNLARSAATSDTVSIGMLQSSHGSEPQIHLAGSPRQLQTRGRNCFVAERLQSTCV